MIQSTNLTSNNPYLQNNEFGSNKQEPKQTQEKENKILKEIEKSAVEVSLSMNAQVILFSMDSEKLSKDLIEAQKDVFNLLSGKETSDGYSLEKLGYEGKPITELSQDEAKKLLEDDGFFSVESTANRVADFVFSFANDDPEIIKKGLEGVIKGFEEAQEIWGGELPEISHKTQERTLELINEKLSQLESTEPKNSEEEKVD